MDKTVEGLLEFIANSPSPFHTVKSAKDLLAAGGFKELSLGDAWSLEPGGQYFAEVYGSALLAFRLGAEGSRGLRLAAAHTDFPCFRIKPAAEICREGYGSLNVESYGGLILSTWQDRPLSLAGRVVLRGQDAFSPESVLVDFARPLMTIPSLAIHMNRKVNEGVALNRQTEMLPLAAMFEREGMNKAFFSEMLARELGCKPAEILSYELTVYPMEAGCCLGIAEEFISSPRLDNLTSVKACIDGLLAGAGCQGIQLIALFDNEEVGSRTKQGAGSAVLMQLLERLYLLRGFTKEQLFADIGRGFMLSADVAHGLHPNYLDKADLTNKPILNGGLVLKQAASQAYAGDAEAVAVVLELCRQHHIPCQQFVNRSDIPGGSTLGSIASALVPIRTMDIGIPMLAMHSARETMGRRDQEAITDLIRVFFTEDGE